MLFVLLILHHLLSFVHQLLNHANSFLFVILVLRLAFKASSFFLFLKLLLTLTLCNSTQFVLLFLLVLISILLEFYLFLQVFFFQHQLLTSNLASISACFAFLSASACAFASLAAVVISAVNAFLILVFCVSLFIKSA